jgi:hypothetical protein
VPNWPAGELRRFFQERVLVSALSVDVIKQIWCSCRFLEEKFASQGFILATGRCAQLHHYAIVIGKLKRL